MMRYVVLAVVIGLGASADEPVTFKSEVAMTRVDAQVVDSTGHPITGLHAKDFILRVDGKVQPIRNFLSENMPIDVLLLLDVSGSMEPHVQRIADASESALRVLAPDDRVAVMVFDTHTRLRLPFRSDHGEISQELHSIIHNESFNGGTHITRALLDAAHYVQKEGRANARRAIVILTDDETQDGEDEAKVERVLDESNAVLSFLRAPYAEDYVNRGRVPSSRRGTWGGSGPVGGGGGPWGEGGPGWPGSGTGSGRGSRLPGGVTVGGPGMDPSHSAGTADIATDSGGDVMPVDGASAFEDTLARLRQRYALHFYWPASSLTAEQRLVTVALSKSAGAEFPHAEVHYRRAYVGSGSGRSSGTLVEVSREPDAADPEGATASAAEDSGARAHKRIDDGERRVAVNEDSGSGPKPMMVDPNASEEQPAAAAPPTAQPTETPKTAAPSHGGWRRVDEQPHP